MKFLKVNKIKKYFLVCRQSSSLILKATKGQKIFSRIFRYYSTFFQYIKSFKDKYACLKSIINF